NRRAVRRDLGIADPCECEQVGFGDAALFELDGGRRHRRHEACGGRGDDSAQHAEHPTMKDMPVRDVIIVGAGPSGLSAAIAAKQRGLDYQVLEKGTLVDSIYRFPPQMVFFTTPELLEIGGLPFVSPYDKPTRAEALRYYRRVVDAYDLQISFEEKVLSVSLEQETAEEASAPSQSLFALETRSVRRV